MRVAGEDLVVGIPIIRVLDRVGIEVPAIVVPVGVHGPELRAICHPCDYPSNTLRVTIFQSPRNSLTYRTDSFLFLNINIPTRLK